METVVPIRAAPQNDTIETLSALLAHAKAGRITGMVVAWRTSDGMHSGMATGLYQEDPIAALGACSKLWAQLNDLSE